MNKSAKLLLGLSIVVFFSACLKSKFKNEIVCDPVEPYAPLRVVDKVTGENLFFSATPRYQITDFNIFKIKDKVFKDTLKTKIFGNGIERGFLIPLNFTNAKDTLVIKVADSPVDLIVYTVVPSTGPCGGNEMNSLKLNNVEVAPGQGPLILKK